MRNLFTNPTRIVEAGAAHSGVASRPQTLQIVNGSAWVTIEGEPHDYWLSTGDVIDIRADRLVVVEADRDDVSLKIGAQARPQIMAAVGRLAHRAWRSIQLALKRPVRQCVSAVDNACREHLSASGWRRLGHL